MAIRLKSQKGFSLVELLVVVAIIGIASSVATLSIRDWLPNYRLRGATADLYVGFQRAKVEALKRQTNCFILFAANQVSYTIFADANGNGLLDDGQANIIEQVNLVASYPGVFIHLNPPLNSFVANASGLRAGGFSTRGLSVNPNNPGFGGGTVTLENQNGRQRQVVMSATGAVRIVE